MIFSPLPVVMSAYCYDSPGVNWILTRGTNYQIPPSQKEDRKASLCTQSFYTEGNCSACGGTDSMENIN